MAQQYQPDVQSSLGETPVLPALKSGVHPQAQQPPQPHGLKQSSEGKRDKPVLKPGRKKRKKENDPTGFNANQSNEMLGTDLSETVVGYYHICRILKHFWVQD